MTRRRLAASLLVSGLVWSVAAPSAATAQVAVAEASLTSLSVGAGSLTELVIPVAATWKIGRLRMDANTAFARATYGQEGVESSLAGLTDVTVRVMLRFLADRGRLILAANIPTGSESLAVDDLPVAAVLTTDLLGLPVRSFGSGTGLTTGLAVARPVGAWVLGGIGVYRVGSAYEPVLGTAAAPASEFRPGSELRLRLAAERPSAGGAAWRVAGSWSRFGSDEAADREIFLRGDRLLGEVSGELPVGRGAASIFAWNLYRSASEILLNEQPAATPASNLSALGGEIAWPLTAAVALRPRAEILVQTGDRGFGGGSGWMARVGSGASYRVGSLRFEPALMAQVGSLEDTGIAGLVVRAGILWAR